MDKQLKFTTAVFWVLRLSPKNCLEFIHECLWYLNQCFTSSALRASQSIQSSRGCTFEDYLWCDIPYHRWPQTPRKSLGVKMAFLSRSLIIFSAPDESNRNSSPAYFLLDLPRELRHIHRLAGGRHPINHEKLAPYLLLLASSLKSMSRLLDRWATQGWAYLFLAWPAIIIEKIQIRVLRLLEVLQILSSSLKGQFIKTML